MTEQFSVERWELEKLARDAADEAAERVLNDFLKRLGIATDKDVLDLQLDLMHLRAGREFRQALVRQSMIAIIGVMLTGAATALWFGIRGLLGK
jgi:hypothetical protein